MPKKPSIADTHPELAKECHPTLNGEITPDKALKGLEVPELNEDNMLTI